MTQQQKNLTKIKFINIGFKGGQVVILGKDTERKIVQKWGSPIKEGYHANVGAKGR